MSSGADIRSELHARVILKLAPDAPPSTWRAAFQREVKAAHPDRGGDSERVRLVIEAYHFLKTQDLNQRQAPPRPGPPSGPEPGAARAEPPPRPKPEAAPTPPPERARPQPDPVIRISIVEAFRGAERLV